MCRILNVQALVFGVRYRSVTHYSSNMTLCVFAHVKVLRSPLGTNTEVWNVQHFNVTV